MRTELGGTRFFMPEDSEGKAFFAAWVEDKKNMRYITSLIDGLRNKMETRFAPLLLPSHIMPSAVLRASVHILSTLQLFSLLGNVQSRHQALYPSAWHIPTPSSTRIPSPTDPPTTPSPKRKIFDGRRGI